MGKWFTFLIVGMFVIVLLPSNTGGINPVIDFNGTIYRNGIAVGAGEKVTVTNLDAQKVFNLETNYNGMFSGDIGEGANLGDELLIIPDVTDTDAYGAYIYISTQILFEEEVQFDIRLSANTGVDPDKIYIGKHWTGPKAGGNGVWGHVGGTPNDAEKDVYGDFFTLKMEWQAHILQAATMGPNDDDEIYDVINDNYDLGYTWYETYTVTLNIVKITLPKQTKQKAFFQSGPNHDLGCSLNFKDLEDAHYDPVVLMEVQTTTWENDSNWYDDEKGWNVEVIVSWQGSLDKSLGGQTVWENPNEDPFGQPWDTWERSFWIYENPEE